MGGRGALAFVAMACTVASLLAAGALPAFAKQGGLARFHVEASFALTPLGPAPPCAPGIRNLSTGSARGTHLGAGTWEADECASFTTTPGSVVANGVTTLTAADGSVLFVRYVVSTPFPDAEGNIHPDGSFTIVGGTGRFAGATGSGGVRSDGNIVTLTQTAVFEGVIDV